eukprot:Tbor_TRINITY_DN4529_c0_g1::TRINITY_DN4529_c0_g1_i1::g.15709::m.15709/K19385/TMEM216; transmembrane protein 216
MQTSRGQGGASFPLQLFLLMDSLVCPIWVIVTIILLIYKKTTDLPFLDGVFEIELIAPMVLFIVNLFAVALGKRGNLTESVQVLIVSFILLVILCCGAGYYMILQTYVLRLDFYLSIVYLCFNVCTLLFCMMGIHSAGGGASNAAAPVIANTAHITR